MDSESITQEEMDEKMILLSECANIIKSLDVNKEHNELLDKIKRSSS